MLGIIFVAEHVNHNILIAQVLSAKQTKPFSEDLTLPNLPLH